MLLINLNNFHTDRVPLVCCSVVFFHWENKSSWEAKLVCFSFISAVHCNRKKKKTLKLGEFSPFSWFSSVSGFRFGEHEWDSVLKEVKRPGDVTPLDAGDKNKNLNPRKDSGGFSHRSKTNCLIKKASGQVRAAAPVCRAALPCGLARCAARISTAWLTQV